MKPDGQLCFITEEWYIQSFRTGMAHWRFQCPRVRLPGQQPHSRCPSAVMESVGRWRSMRLHRAVQPVSSGVFNSRARPMGPVQPTPESLWLREAAGRRGRPCRAATTAAGPRRRAIAPSLEQAVDHRKPDRAGRDATGQLDRRIEYARHDWQRRSRRRFD